MAEVPADAAAVIGPGLTARERADAGELLRDLPLLRHQVQELDVLLQQNALELESQRVRADNAGTTLRQLEQGGPFSREQYQQVVAQAHQGQLRYLSVQHQQELLQSKRETVQQVIDVGEFALGLAARLDPDAIAAGAPPPAAVQPDRAAEAPAAAEPLPPPSESAILEAQEEERSWIARQLHNGPAQALTNLILRAEICERHIAAADPDAAKGELHDLRQTIHGTLQDMRRFIFDVRPMILDDLGTVPALRRFVDDWNAHDARSPVTLSVIGSERRFARSKELAIFRIVQDAIKAPESRGGEQATAVQIVIEEDAIKVTMETPTSARPEAAQAADTVIPSGYHTIQQRAAIVGGTTNLETRSGARVLKITVPLREAPVPPSSAARP